MGREGEEGGAHHPHVPLQFSAQTNALQGSSVVVASPVVKCDVDVSATVVVELLCVCCGRRRNRVDGECRNEWHVALRRWMGEKCAKRKTCRSRKRDARCWLMHAQKAGSTDGQRSHNIRPRYGQGMAKAWPRHGQGTAGGGQQRLGSLTRSRIAYVIRPHVRRCRGRHFRSVRCGRRVFNSSGRGIGRVGRVLRRHAHSTEGDDKRHACRWPKSNFVHRVKKGTRKAR